VTLALRDDVSRIAERILGYKDKWPTTRTYLDLYERSKSMDELDELIKNSNFENLRLTEALTEIQSEIKKLYET